MYFTREEDWKEIKLGRIYKDEDLMEVSDHINFMGIKQKGYEF